MLKRYCIAYKFSSVNGFKVVYATNKEEAVEEFYKSKICQIKDNAKLDIKEQSIDNKLLYSLERKELIDIISKLLK